MGMYGMKNQPQQLATVLTCRLVLEEVTEDGLELLTVNVLEGKGCEIVPHEGLKHFRATNKVLHIQKQCSMHGVESSTGHMTVQCNTLLEQKPLQVRLCKASQP